MKCRAVPRRVLRRLKGIHDHKPAFFCTDYHRAGENKSSHTLPDMSGEDSSIHRVPYKVGKVPSMAFCICDDYSVADMLPNISGCMNDRWNKGGHIGAGI